MIDFVDFGLPPGEGPLRENGRSVGSLPSTGSDLPSARPASAGGGPLPLEGPDSPATRNQASEAQLAAARFCRAMLAGNEVVKAGGQTFLPRFPGEDHANYASRLELSVFTPYYARTISGYVDYVFAKDIVLGDDVPEQIRQHWENVDLQGNHGTVFYKKVLTDALTVGASYVLVEFPKTSGMQSLADERDPVIGLRPYHVHLRKEQFVNWHI